MKQLIRLIIITLALPVFAIAEVYSWVDAGGVRHFSNQPPPETARSVQVSEELRSSIPVERSGKPNAPAVKATSSPDLPDSNVEPTLISPEDTPQKGNDLIAEEKQKLELKLQALNQRLVDAEQSRSRGSSYDYQGWTNRIEQIQNEISYEKRQADGRIQQIKIRHGIN